jgi:2-polyprenyl-6-methoxyphenol hydroxylase-like FAD-dependent oxidoreductase
LTLSGLKSDFPFIVFLPQSALEELLEKRLGEHRSVTMHWNHRLTGIRHEGGAVVATVDKLGETSKGYIVPSWEWVVEKTLQTRARYVIGADGHNSVVRTSLGIDYEQFKGTETFAVYELELAEDPGSEVKIVLGKTTSVFWPLPGNRCRWSFQFPADDELADFPPKDRTPWRIVQPSVDDDIKREAAHLIAERAPWFQGRIQDVDWSINVQFEHRLVKRFGSNGCWLAGDAAHQTGPVGMQSMNLGLAEAEELATALADVLQGHAPASSLEAYQATNHARWRRMLGIDKGLKATDQTDPWIKERIAQLLPCIPASGDDLKSLAGQLNLTWD